MDFAKTVWGAAEGQRLLLLASMVAQIAGPLLVLIVIGDIVQADQSPDTNVTDIFLLVFGSVCVVGGAAISTRLSSATVEGMLHEMRMRISRQLREIEYQKLERMGPTTVYDSLTRNSAVISEAAMVVMPAMAAAGALVVAGLYTLTISTMVFLTVGAILGTSAFFYRLSQRSTYTQFGEAAQRETAFLERFGHLLHGFKEVSLHRPRGHDLVEDDLMPASDAVREARTHTAVLLSRGMSISYGFFYVMVLAIAFILPPYIQNHDVIVHALYISFFLLSLVEIIHKSMPLISRAEYARSEIARIEETLEAARREGVTSPAMTSFKEIALEAVTFDYLDSKGNALFSMGPVTFTLRRGETVFIVGGNGSGKSTLIKVLCRLYRPSSGVMRLDRQPLDDGALDRFRSLFSTVLTDFHLFGQLYGLRDRSAEEINALLEDLEIGQKVRFEDGAFSTTELSTGQRKRLAFAVALLERRPILILDELAADQDHEFRERFYRRILPALKAEGRTLVVISHDKRFDDVADRVIQLRSGVVVGQKNEPGETA
ncbi:MAG: cyclic peptide export ABC transporter [Pseudomonadota bacterium]